jgi:AraC-like DNA-binding protein
MNRSYFETYSNPDTIIRNRIINTPSEFAKKSFFYIQETGYLKSSNSRSHTRKNLDSYLFFIVLSGDGSLTYQSNTYSLQQYNCVLIDCKEEYSHENNSDNPWELLWFHFNGPLATQYYSYFLQSSSNIYQTSRYDEIIDSINTIIDIHKDKTSVTELLASKYITDILTMSITNQIALSQISHHTISEKMYEIRQYLDNNYTQKISLEDLEKSFFISRFYLTREYKKIYGVTIINYLQDKRLTKAKELLRFTHLPIEAIAEQCGIPDPNYFNKVFKKSEAMTASDYRKKW